MRLGIVRHAILALALTGASATPLFAQTDTSLSGGVNGRELCEQAVCGSAIFAAVFAGQIDSRPAVGLAIGALRHTPLPRAPEDDCAIILGGSWSISTLRRTLAGSIEPMTGTVCYIDGTKFQVSLTMNIDHGGSGEAKLAVVLDHGPFPPTVKGTISQ